jgi:hypothetical protein
MPSATIQFGDGHVSFARLQTVSVTGGLLRVLKPLSSGAVVELMFSTLFGSVLAMVELLNPCSGAPIGLQPFRFITMDDAELRQLCAAICIVEQDVPLGVAGIAGNQVFSSYTTPSASNHAPRWWEVPTIGEE